jgi:hypothetical protein
MQRTTAPSGATEQSRRIAMPSYENLSTEQLNEALKKSQALLQDARDERAFLGKQTSMHIKVAELNRLDQDIERYQGRVEEIEALIAEKAA